MLRILGACAVVVLLGLAIAVLKPQPALSGVCDRRPDHPRCVTPTPTPSAGWVEIFRDDFTTDVPLGQFPSAVSDRWTAYPYPWSTLGGYYYPEKVNSISNGMLHFHLHAENGQWLMSAPGPILPSGSTSQLYGRYEARFRTDGLSGYYAAWLLWPRSETWPRDGELDFPEGNLTGNIGGFVHHQGATSGSDQTSCPTSVPFAGQWHTVVTEWTPNAIRYYLDGALVCKVTDRIPNTPMRWVLQTTTSPSGLPPTGTAGYLDVDWVAVYAP